MLASYLIRTYIVCLLAVNYFSAQESVAPIRLLPYKHEALYIPLAKDPAHAGHYKKADKLHSTQLHLNADSSFLFLHNTPDSSRITLGTYQRRGDKITLRWDSLNTLQFTSDRTKYSNYELTGVPQPLKIENWQYTVKESRIEPYVPIQKSEMLELLYTSKDLFKEGNEVIKDFKEINYEPSGNTIIVTYGDDQHKLFPKFRLWGFVIHDGSARIYRRTKKGFNWYGIPGVQIAQFDDIVIYTVGENRRYSYFSRGLDSPILPLKLKELKREFHDNKKFIALLKETFPVNRTLTDLDGHFNSYKVVELYLKSKSL